jgi:hypothetical protein
VAPSFLVHDGLAACSITQGQRTNVLLHCLLCQALLSFLCFLTTQYRQLSLFYKTVELVEWDTFYLQTFCILLVDRRLGCRFLCLGLSPLLQIARRLTTLMVFPEVCDPLFHIDLFGFLVIWHLLFTCLLYRNGYLKALSFKLALSFKPYLIDDIPEESQ